LIAYLVQGYSNFVQMKLWGHKSSLWVVSIIKATRWAIQAHWATFSKNILIIPGIVGGAV